jgi:hypothetical protein
MMVREAAGHEQLFRERLASALQSHRYSLTGFDRLNSITVAPELIKPGQFQFGSDEVLLGDGIKITGVRMVAGALQTRDAQNDPPGRKPGRQSAKDRACEAVLSILNDAKRPLRGHGRKAELARMVRTALLKEGHTYQENTVQGMIRGTVTDWEAKNPDK